MSVVGGPFCGTPLTTAGLPFASAVTIALSSSAVRAQAPSSLVNNSNLLPSISSATSLPSLSGVPSTKLTTLVIFSVARCVTIAIGGFRPDPAGSLFCGWPTT